MTGLAVLVPTAELLEELAGGRAEATQLAIEILKSGEPAIGRSFDDVRIALRTELRRTGVTDQAGVPHPGRAAELVAVCEVLRASSPPVARSDEDPKLVLSAPPGTVTLADDERLEGLVLDSVRMAVSSLVIGGAFWNDAGFAILDSVLAPALQVRRVPTTLYVNQPGEEFASAFRERLTELSALGPLTVRWFVGPRPTMLHAKFVIRDRMHGYLGTANLTSWGMGGHVEAGVELTEGQCRRFLAFLSQLELAGLFSA